jgi:hypothetical protein
VIICTHKIACYTHKKPLNFIDNYAYFLNFFIIDNKVFLQNFVTHLSIKNKGKRCWSYKRFSAKASRGGFDYLQYADDTLICLNVDKCSIVNTKFLLYCFKNMSDLKNKLS